MSETAAASEWIVLSACVWAAAILGLFASAAWRWRLLWPLLAAALAAALIVLADYFLGFTLPISDFVTQIADDDLILASALERFLTTLLQQSAPVVERVIYALAALAAAGALFFRTLSRRPALLVPMAVVVEIGLAAVLTLLWWNEGERVVAFTVIGVYVVATPIQLFAGLVTGLLAAAALSRRRFVLPIIGILASPTIIRLLPVAVLAASILYPIGITQMNQALAWGMGVGLVLWGGFAALLLWLRFPRRYLSRRRLG